MTAYACDLLLACKCATADVERLFKNCLFIQQHLLADVLSICCVIQDQVHSNYLCPCVLVEDHRLRLTGQYLLLHLLEGASSALSGTLCWLSTSRVGLMLFEPLLSLYGANGVSLTHEVMPGVNVAAIWLCQQPLLATASSLQQLIREGTAELDARIIRQQCRHYELVTIHRLFARICRPAADRNGFI